LLLYLVVSISHLPVFSFQGTFKTSGISQTTVLSVAVSVAVSAAKDAFLPSFLNSDEIRFLLAALGFVPTQVQQK
jgi:hypothetical protein